MCCLGKIHEVAASITIEFLVLTLCCPSCVLEKGFCGEDSSYKFMRSCMKNVQMWVILNLVSVEDNTPYT